MSRFIPCKITSAIHAEELLNGDVFMRPLSEFGIWDTGSDITDRNRRDLLEGSAATFEQDGRRVAFIDESDIQYFKVFCTYCLEIIDDEPVKPDQRVKDFGDTVVVFRDYNSFLLRWGKAAEEKYKEHVDLLGRINYYNPAENRMLNPLFEKINAYSYQNELRLAFCESEKNPFLIGPGPEYSIIFSKERVTLNVGDIRDIAYAIPIEQFMDCSGIEGKHHPPETGDEGAPFDFLVARTNEEMARYRSIMVRPVTMIY